MTNKRLANIGPSLIRSLDEKFSQIDGIIKFTLGEPDFAMPDRAKEAMKAAIDQDYSHYAHSAGTPGLRQAFANHFERHHGVELNPDQVLVTVGATEGIYASLTTLLNEGDQVLVPAPCFPLYHLAVNLAGGEVVSLDTQASNFKVTPSQLESYLSQYPHIKAIILNFPSNPTGATYSAAEIQALAQVVEKYPDLYVISDEIYADLVYGISHVSFLNYLPEQTILLSGASKSFAMTGLRVGIMYLPKDIYQATFAVHQVMVTCVATPNQMAAEVAYNECDEDLEAMRLAYQDRLNRLQSGLEEIGFEVGNPQGAFYIFPKVPVQLGMDDVEFAYDLAEKARVAVIPGQAFGPAGKGYFRMSFATSYDEIVEALDRMASYMSEKLK
ncbi:aspartate aminotransferase [Aerococcus urinaehominis]|uniref:Aminotransferase n=1 Tax=Aerococcus urinaehominis TaxID=128944 RepID=A0A0X8FLD2_9LACT|nr:aminotransferase class I/II-fold pyridoxal phosphate-dependent enzyme [Aerococcus urinaehominis]AMB99214.1 aspartate aminotransferase [Aerococcus urinaehominis]SDM32151.1 aminotransferase [Aerococcus urinaehominis]